MQWLAYILVAAVAFGLCYLIDKGFTKLFRSKAQHKSGLAVKLSSKYALGGIVLALLGIVAIFSGLEHGPVLLIGGAIVLLMGAGLIVYYLSFGVFYDDDGFLLTTFGKKSVTYRFSQIRAQRLYALQGGSVVIELQLSDGQTLMLQSVMEGVYPFLDHAFKVWCSQTGRDPESCGFHNPSQSRWFPEEEEA